MVGSAGAAVGVAGVTAADALRPVAWVPALLLVAGGLMRALLPDAVRVRHTEPEVPAPDRPFRA